MRKDCQREVIVAQLIERSLAILDVPCSNPVIDKIYTEHLCTVSCIEKTKIKKKSGEWPI